MPGSELLALEINAEEVTPHETGHRLTRILVVGHDLDHAFSRLISERCLMNRLHQMAMQTSRTVKTQSVIWTTFAIDGNLNELVTLAVEGDTMAVEDVDMHTVGAELLLYLGDEG